MCADVSAASGAAAHKQADLPEFECSNCGYLEAQCQLHHRFSHVVAERYHQRQTSGQVADLCAGTSAASNAVTHKQASLP